MFGEHDPSLHEYFVDNRLCFGFSFSLAIFTRLSNATVCLMARRGFSAIVDYLDDFVIIRNTYTLNVNMVSPPLLIVFIHSGFNIMISWKKVVCPSQRVPTTSLLAHGQLAPALNNIP